MNKILKSIFFLGAILFFASTLSAGAEKHGAEYFYAIDGEVSGQTAPGVQAVYVNGKHVPVDANLNFQTSVHLEKGQKYLNIETRYKGLRFIKKYLVIRHPKTQKTFKIHIPEKEFKKIIKPKKRSVVHRRKIIRKKPTIKPKLKQKKPMPSKKKWLGYQFVAELAPGKLMMIRSVDGKYFAKIYHPESGQWIPLHSLSHQEFKELLEEGKLPPSFNP